jgi:ribosomal protein S18 acetylase RimI-like enzyme
MREYAMYPVDIELSGRIDFMVGTMTEQQTSDHVHLNPACEVSLNTLADLFNRSYYNYFVPIHMDAGALSWLLSTLTIDLASSHVMYVGDEPVGFIFISARGLSQRVSAMGVVPGHRGMGYGQKMLKHCIEHASGMGVHRMVLEVIDENAHAISIYRQLGFDISRYLIGYQLDAGIAEAGSDELPDEIDPREVAKATVHEGAAGLPWQIASESWFATRPPSRAYTLERSVFAIVSHVTDARARLDAIVVPRTKRRKGWGRRMLEALYRLYPNREWMVNAVVPEDLATEFFQATGFQRHKIRQYEMVLRLDETSSRYPYES